MRTAAGLTPAEGGRLSKKPKKTFRRVDSTDPKDWDHIITDEAEVNMKEVKFDATKHTVIPKENNIRELLDSLLDKMKADAEALLKKMVKEEKIQEYRVMPIGATTTQDFKAGRISVTVDASGKVVDALQG